MAVTHADLEPRRGRRTKLSSKTNAFFIVLTILLGVFCFILCLIAEATRSKVKWMSTGENGKGSKYECVYSGSGRMPLICAACAFIGLAIAVLVEHTYMLIAVSNLSPDSLTLDPHSGSAKSLNWQAGIFFITNWICFAVGEIVLLAGVSVESGHLKNWSKPKASCLGIRKGLFSAAGVFALATVFLASALYLTALRILQDVTREVPVTSSLHASPPRPSQPQITALTRENPTTKHTSFPTPFNKPYTFV
ncbi:hypothetical protein VNO78_22759 [Psophocarpus tetragonolobus]|uniref:Transmembrane protein n=1 Tax=Psophocarpus tetragonolobus TaxID=3891 RepID=A0AAN9XCJ5_PSOTE